MSAAGEPASPHEDAIPKTADELLLERMEAGQSDRDTRVKRQAEADAERGRQAALAKLEGCQVEIAAAWQRYGAHLEAFEAAFQRALGALGAVATEQRVISELRTERLQLALTANVPPEGDGNHRFADLPATAILRLRRSWQRGA